MVTREISERKQAELALLESDATGRTSVPGVWVAGNASDLSAQVSAAVAEGARAAQQINADLVMEDDTGKRTHTYAYGPTGLPRGTTTEAVPQPFRYSGAYLDPTGLYEMGHRYYDTQIGRFNQPDPRQPALVCAAPGLHPLILARTAPIDLSEPSS